MTLIILGKKELRWAKLDFNIRLHSLIEPVIVTALNAINLESKYNVYGFRQMGEQMFTSSKKAGSVSICLLYHVYIKLTMNYFFTISI